ncbi:DUF6663 family protein [Halorarius halobius]|uniref:DUF6663 family protein n=1 Tax=Halorarius halobius TaxID=2962671 RepID=UPI0020CEEB59|nr:DUF6663 family protein [Halorarius halobius]
MEQTTEGTFRVLASTRRDDEWLLLDVESGDPTYVPATGYDGALAERVAELEPGNRVEATLSWTDGDARFADLTRVSESRVHFVRTTEPLFEAAERCWRDAREQNAGMNSRVTHGTDGEPNGVVYTFAEQPGEQDLFEEFRDGVKPLEPLLVRAAGGRDGGADAPDPPFETFVLAHPDQPFVTVYIVLDPDGYLAETVRDTYLDEVGSGGLADRL